MKIRIINILTESFSNSYRDEARQISRFCLQMIKDTLQNRNPKISVDSNFWNKKYKVEFKILDQLDFEYGNVDTFSGEYRPANGFIVIRYHLRNFPVNYSNIYPILYEVVFHELTHRRQFETANKLINLKNKIVYLTKKHIENIKTTHQFIKMYKIDDDVYLEIIIEKKPIEQIFSEISFLADEIKGSNYEIINPKKFSFEGKQVANNSVKIIAKIYIPENEQYAISNEFYKNLYIQISEQVDKYKKHLFKNYIEKEVYPEEIIHPETAKTKEQKQKQMQDKNFFSKIELEAYAKGFYSVYKKYAKKKSEKDKIEIEKWMAKYISLSYFRQLLERTSDFYFFIMNNINKIYPNANVNMKKVYKEMSKINSTLLGR